MDDNILPDPSGPDILAGEYALGVLEGAELAEAQRLMLADRDFAARVEWWRVRLGAMAEDAGEFAPSPEVWAAIERRLHDQTGSEGGAPAQPVPLKSRTQAGLSGWNLGAAFAGVAAVAAALTFVFIQPPPASTPGPAPTTAAPGERLIAQGQSEDGALTLAGLVDPADGTLQLNLAGFAPGEGQAPELWVVPEGGAPQSLGLIPAEGTFARDLTADEAEALLAGAALAVTYEDSASAPHDAPTSEILLIGGLSRV